MSHKSKLRLLARRRRNSVFHPNFDRMEHRTLLTTFMVTSTADAGAGSLRQAILDANSRSGHDLIKFAIGSGFRTISPTSPLPTISDSVTIDATTQPGYSGKPIIELSGVDAGANADGFKVAASECVVRGFVINRFSGNGVYITGGNSSGNTVESNYVGTNAAGAVALGNGLSGIAVNVGVTGTTIGGVTAKAGNLISGNEKFGIYVGGTSNTVVGNYIGTDATGTTSLGNKSAGILVTGARNSIGGAPTGAGNVISGNGERGVTIGGAAASNNLVIGNIIGLAQDGVKPLGNASDGVFLDPGAGAGNVVGGEEASTRNIISANGLFGVRVIASGSRIVGNYIGTDKMGTVARGNASGGVLIHAGGSDNVIEKNVVSGNGTKLGDDGIEISGDGTTRNRVIGNLIGTNAAGTAALPNFEDGVYVTSSANTIGGTSSETRNVISGNLGDGIELDGNGATGNAVLGNYIGTDVKGGTILGNKVVGIRIKAGASNNTIGGIATGEGNLIRGSGRNGVEVSGVGSIRNRIQGNLISGNAWLSIDLRGNGKLEPSDAGDLDDGPNRLQNSPQLSLASIVPYGIVEGTLSSVAGREYVLSFYAQPSLDQRGTAEAWRYLGSRSVKTDGTGVLSFSERFNTLQENEFISATATDADGNTSELSIPVMVNSTPTSQFRLLETVLDEGLRTRDIANYHKSSWRIPGLEPGDRVYISLSRSGVTGPSDITELTVSGQSDLPSKVFNYDPVSYIGYYTIPSFVATTANLTVTVEMWGLAAGEGARLTVSLDRALGNVTVARPVIAADGGVTTSAKVGSHSLRVGGEYVPLALYYARLEGGNYRVLKLIKDTGLSGLHAGAETKLSVAAKDMPTPDVTATHVIALFNRRISPDGLVGSTSLVSELSLTDNLVATPLPKDAFDIAADSLEWNEDGGLTFKYHVEGRIQSQFPTTVKFIYYNNKTKKFVGDFFAPKSVTVAAVGDFEVVLDRNSLPRPRAGADGVFAMIDQEGAVPETLESNYYSYASLKPNYHASPPTWEPNGDLLVRYSVTGGTTAAGLRPVMQVFWASGDTLDKKISLVRPAINLGLAPGRQTARINARQFNRAPEGATHIIVALDPPTRRRPNGLVDEFDEDDNVVVVSLGGYDYEALNAEWNIGRDADGRVNGLFSNGNLEFRYRVHGVQLPQTTGSVYWVSSKSPDALLGDAVISAPLSSLSGNVYNINVPIAMLVVKPDGADALKLILDPSTAENPLGSVQETNETNNTVVFDDLYDITSYELGLPRGRRNSTRFALVHDWLKLHAPVIAYYEQVFSVDRRAIAGAIAWEALVNVQAAPRQAPPLVPIDPFAHGPGKVHYANRDASTFSTPARHVEGEAAAARYGISIPDYAVMLPSQNRVWHRANALLDTDTSIKYIAAIMNAYAVEAEIVGDPRLAYIRVTPEILATYYNGITYRRLRVTLQTNVITRNAGFIKAAEYFRQRSQQPRDSYKPSGTMGQWVQNNLAYLESAVGSPRVFQ